MFKALNARLKLGHRTMRYPEDVKLPDRFRGAPRIDAARCPEGCRTCAEACPTGAILARNGHPLRVDLGRCLSCPVCAEACPAGAIALGAEHRLAVRERDDLVRDAGGEPALAAPLDGKLRRLLGRSLKLRQVSAGGCNGCEADVNVLNTLVFDLGRFGIGFVASPRHADGILVTGPVTENMRLGLQKTWEAVPSPRIVIAVGACAISGGPYIDHPETLDGVDSLIPVDLYVPGCPPHPLTILDGLLRLIGKVR